MTRAERAALAGLLVIAFVLGVMTATWPYAAIGMLPMAFVLARPARSRPVPRDSVREEERW